MEVFLSSYIAPWRIVDRLTLTLESGGQHSKGAVPMASKKAQVERPNVRFVNIRVPAEKKEDSKVWVKQLGRKWLAEVEHLCQAGYKLGATWDGRNNCFIVSITCWDNESANYGLCFSTRHIDVEAAFGLVLYKVLEILGETNWEDHDSSDNWG